MTMSIPNIGNVASGAPAAPAASASQSVKATQAVGAPAVAEDANDNQPDSKQLQIALDKLKKVAQASSSDLQFSVDKESGKTIVRVVDTITGDLIRQIPSKDVLEISKSIETMQGMLFKKEA
jgi:flagellar protein FlaG